MTKRKRSPRCIVIAGPNGAGKTTFAARVRQGGHDVPKRDVIRRFKRGWEKFQQAYRPMAVIWAVYDNSGALPQLLEEKK